MAHYAPRTPTPSGRLCLSSSRSRFPSASPARAFVCSERFRVNAQKKSLDVWLNYRCDSCEDVWKFPLLERRPVSELGPALDDFARHDRLAQSLQVDPRQQDALRKRVRDGQRVYMLSKRDLTAERQNGGTSVL